MRCSTWGWLVSVSQMKGTGRSFSRALVSRKREVGGLPEVGGVLVCLVLAGAPVGAPRRAGDPHHEPAGADQRDRAQPSADALAGWGREAVQRCGQACVA